MTYYGTDHTKQATSYSRSASAATRRAERDAREAERFYQEAAKVRRQAARCTANYGLWDAELHYTPALIEADARMWVRLGDTFLRASFHATKMAAHYRGLAADYRAMAKRQAAVPDYAAVS